jgi:hypothetical protein
MLTAGLDIFQLEHVAQHRDTTRREVHVQLVDPAHQIQRFGSPATGSLWVTSIFLCARTVDATERAGQKIYKDFPSLASPMLVTGLTANL